MDLKELKKLINEEVNRRKTLQEQEPPEKTGAGTPGAKAAQKAGLPTKPQQAREQRIELETNKIKQDAAKLSLQIKQKALILSKFMSGKQINNPGLQTILGEIQKAGNISAILEKSEFSIPNISNKFPDQIAQEFWTLGNDLQSLFRQLEILIEDAKEKAYNINYQTIIVSEIPGLPMQSEPTQISKPPQPSAGKGVFSSLFKENKRRK